MRTLQKAIRSPVVRKNAGQNLLISLLGFALIVIATRIFLQLTGFPQVGNSVLHIAHALWGGLLLFVAVLLPLSFANRWATRGCALLSGIGVGLFIDEVGKFITQTNDYFFPAALPVIYSFFLLTVVLLLVLRRPREAKPRTALYHALVGLKDVLDGDLDAAEASNIEAQLTIARQSDRQELVSLADAISAYLSEERQHLSPAAPGFWKRIRLQFTKFGTRLGQRKHHFTISAILILWTLVTFGFIFILLLEPASVDSQILQYSNLLIAIQAFTGILLIAAAGTWFSGRDSMGMNFAIVGFLLSLVALQTLYFYLSQFQALTVTLLQFTFLLILFSYRKRYLSGKQTPTSQSSLAGR